jgi:hypothetical protein
VCPASGTKKPRNGSDPLRGLRTEAEGLEPPRACARLISNQLPYQLDYASRNEEPMTRGTVRVIDPAHNFTRSAGAFQARPILAAEPAPRGVAQRTRR